MFIYDKVVSGTKYKEKIQANSQITHFSSYYI